MKTIIYYFTSTGNSLAVARILASQLENAELVNIAKVVNEEVRPECYFLGISTPVYCWGLPNIVVKFLRKLAPRNAPYIFGLATCGGMPGATLRQMKEILAEQSLKLSSGFSFTGYNIPALSICPDWMIFLLSRKSVNDLMII